MIVNIEELKSILIHLLVQLQKSKGNIIELPMDYYWDISLDEIYNPYIEPQNINLGQLSDDIEELKNAKVNDNLIPYDLKRVANLLTAISINNQTTF